ncbi:MAG: hypothetical protein WCO00_14420 [Rhodospirillaceae bacterium]
MSRVKLARLATTLDFETLDGKVRWTAMPPPSDMIRGTDSIITQVFETEYNEIKLRVFEKRVKCFIDDVNYCWDYPVVLQFVGDNGAPDWEAENIAGVRELIDTIKLRTCRVEQKIDAILAA